MQEAALAATVAMVEMVPMVLMGITAWMLLNLAAAQMEAQEDLEVMEEMQPVELQVEMEDSFKLLSLKVIWIFFRCFLLF